MAPEPIQEDPGFWKDKSGANDLVIPPPANQPAAINFPIFLFPFPVAQSTEAISDVFQQQPATNLAPQQQLPTDNNFILFTIDPITLEPLAVILSSSLFMQQAQTDPMSTLIGGSTPAVTGERDNGSLNVPSAVGSEVVTDDQDTGSLNLLSAVDSVDLTADQDTDTLNLFSGVDSLDVTADQDTGGLNLFPVPSETVTVERDIESLNLHSGVDLEVLTVERDTESLNLHSGVDLEVLTVERDTESLNLSATVDSVDTTAQRDTRSFNRISGLDLESTTGITTECLVSNVPLDEISTSALSPEIGASNISPHLNS